MPAADPRTDPGRQAAASPEAAGPCCHLVGGGIAGLAAAFHLIRDAGVPPERIHVLEQEAQAGGSLDAAGSIELGFSMRGSRMFGPAYVLSYELFDSIPSLDDPAKSIMQEMAEFWQASPWYDKARLVERGQVVDPSAWGLRNRDRADLVKLMVQPDEALQGRRIDEVFEANFFESNFWLMWSSMFGFETWHSADELRRYLLRFLRLFPDLETMQIIQSTRYGGHDSIVRPLVRWLRERGVRFDTGVQVSDLSFAAQDGRKAVRRLHVLRDGQPDTIEVGERDLVMVTLGSMTADSTLGSMDRPPAPSPDRGGGAWALWRRLAAQDAAFGRPDAFCGEAGRSTWITFTVTDRDLRFFQRMERLSGSPAGGGGLVTLKDSPWLLTFHLYHTPAYAGQPEGTGVWWGYGLYPDRPGAFVDKPMLACSGREILVELFSQLGFQDELPALLAAANCIPCRLPYATSQFMPRRRGDRPAVIPPGTTNLAFLGQYCEIAHDVVFTVEYSVHSARLAVAALCGLPPPLPPTYEGLEHPNALVEALRRILVP